MSDASATMAEHWRDLVTVALLGTDRREPPGLAGPIADLVDDTVRDTPSERMLAAVAAATVVRRAAVLPGAPVPLPAPVEPDPRPVCVPAAAERWHHLVASWTVLEDEWMITVVERGLRLPAELVPAALRRHRSDPVRHARVRVAAGPLADWLIDHLGDLDCGRAGTVDPAALVELPPLPIPPELVELGDRAAGEIAHALASGIDADAFGAAHRAVLVNLVARLRPSVLPDVATALGRVASPTGAGLAASLADLATTRHRMLDELGVVASPGNSA